MPRARVTSFVNEKGGVGKTTITIVLAGCLAAIGRRILLAEIDPQGSGSDFADAAEANGGLPFDFVSTSDPADLAKLRLIDTVDHVLVDTPGNLETGDGLIRMVAEQSDLVVMPLEVAPMSINPTRKTVETVMRPLGVPHVALLSRHNTAEVGADRDMRATLVGMGIPVLKTVMRAYSAHKWAVTDGLTPDRYPIRSRGDRNARDDANRLTLEVLGIHEGGIPASLMEP